MASYKLTMMIDAARRESVEKKLREVFGADIPIHVLEKDNTPTSRAAQLAEAEAMVEDAKSIVEGLKDEIQEWHDNLPENFQDGEKGQALESCVEELDQISSDLDSVDMSSVEFSGMY